MRERIFSYARYAVGDVDGGETGTTIKCFAFDVCQTVGDVDGGETGAERER